MFKLENYSLRKRMYIVAGLGITGLLLFAVLCWYLQTSQLAAATQWQITAAYIVIASVIVMYLAHVIGRFGDSRATMLVTGIQNIKKGDLTQKIVISGRSDFS